MSSPARSPVPKKRSNVASAESVCPFTGKPLDDAQPYFVSTNIHDRYNNIVTDHYAFITLSGEYEHRWFLPDVF